MTEARVFVAALAMASKSRQEKTIERAEVGKVTLKNNSNKVLSNESVLKSNGDKTLNDDFS
jgi:hypothetical protein